MTVAIAAQTVKVQENDISLLFDFSTTTAVVQPADIARSGYDHSKIVSYISMIGTQVLTKTAAKGVVGQTLLKIPAGGIAAFPLTSPVTNKDEMLRLFLSMTTDVSTLAVGDTIAIPHGLIDPAGLLSLPLFSGIKATGADDNAKLENARKLGLGVLMSFTCAQLVLNQVGLDDLSRQNGHTAYAQLTSQAAASKYVPLSGLASASLATGGRDATGLATILSGSQLADIKMRLQAKNNGAFQSTRPGDFAYLQSTTPALKKRTAVLR